MKICIGYYDKDGTYIGNKLDDPNREKYFIVMGTLKNKIAEHIGQNPYKHHTITDWSKTFCDKTRIELYVDIYINNKLNESIKSCTNWWTWQRNASKKQLYNIIELIFKDVKTRFKHNLIRKYNIEKSKYIYFPIHIY